MYPFMRPFLWPLFFGLLAAGPCYGQSPEARALYDRVYRYNNAFKYDSSQLLIHAFLSEPYVGEEDAYHAYLYMADTYKRLFDYPTTLRYLNTALSHGLRTKNKAYYLANIRCQKALALFDTQAYSQADSLMKLLSASRYAHLDGEYRSKIVMQEAYLLFLAKQYGLAETTYDRAITLMRGTSPCDLPMIYAKKIQLYGAMHEDTKLQDVYGRSLRAADSCRIYKYAMYTEEMMYQTYKAQGNYTKAFQSLLVFDSLQDHYNKEERLDKIAELDKKYQTERKEQEIIAGKKEITYQHTWILLLMAIIVAIILGLVIYRLGQKQRQLEQERERSQAFTQLLFAQIEEERRRIATDLHDSVSHSILALKNNLYEQPHLGGRFDELIAEIRGISRNLHPIMLAKVGLRVSVEQLVERIQHSDELFITASIAYAAQLPLEKELQVYRIIQEGLNNILKYAHARAAKVTLVVHEASLLVEIKDNGIGFEVKKTIAGGNAFGLSSIVERSKALGGSAHIQSAPTGTRISVTIPLA